LSFVRPDLTCPAQELEKKDLNPAGRETLDARILAVNRKLTESFRVTPLVHRATWKGRESRNFGLLAPHLLAHLVETPVLRLWTSIATLFSMMYFPECTAGFADAVGIVARLAISGILEHYPKKDGDRRTQLNLHTPLYLSSLIRKLGPATLFDTERSENAQSKVSDISKLTSRSMEEYTLRNAACWHVMSLRTMIEDKESALHASLMSASMAADSVRESTTRSGPQYYILDGMPLKKGAVVCQLSQTTPKCAEPASVGDFDRQFYEYFAFEDIDQRNHEVVVSPLKQPSHSLLQTPFAFVKLHGELTLPISSVHRCVATLPAFVEDTSDFDDVLQVVVPTRFIMC
jgi:hypothetical protein